MTHLLALFIFWSCSNLAGADTEIEDHDLPHLPSQRKRDTVVAGDNQPMDPFIIDIITTWKLLSPTIIYQEEIPSLCWTHAMILCVTYHGKMKDLAEHLAMIHRDRKQDGVIFVGSQVPEQFLTKIVYDVTTFFSSECPVFMPKYDYKKLNLRLDSNVIFYDRLDEGKYELLDIFAVKGGTPITLNLGMWDIDNGIRFQMCKNRWERRTDLNGAIFVNGLYPKHKWANPIRDQKGNIVGSEGMMQEKLFYFTDRMNMTIKTIEYTNKRQLLKNGTWEGPFGMIQRGEIDIDSVGIGVTMKRSAIIDFPIPTVTKPAVFIARRPEGTAPDAWVYVRVFGIPQWLIFFTSLALIVIGLSVINIMSKDESINSFGVKRGAKERYQLTTVLSNISFVYLCAIQMGSHMSTKQAAIRIMTITTSFMTFIIYAYYSSEITAKMTSGPSQFPVRTFKDVIKEGYSVVAPGDYYETLLAQSDPRSARYEVYKRHVEPDKDALSRKDAIKKVATEEKVLYFAAEWTIVVQASYVQPYRNQLFAVKLDEKMYAQLSFGLTKDSEFLPLFNHFILKEYEAGIMMKLYREYQYPIFRDQQFGMPEPSPLSAKNVMFLFTWLGLGICVSCLIAVVEKVRKKCTHYLTHRGKHTHAFQPNN